VTLAAERALFEACFALSATERAAWLLANCPDPEQRGRVDRLLRAHDAAEAGRGISTGGPAPEFTERRIGPYRVFERIGEGAMGEVYLAEQTAPVVRRVALKIIKLGMDTREVIARFETERQTLAIMSHPSIAQIFDAGATETGRPYFAMEYVPGIPLTEYCEAHRLDLPARLALFLEICDGVQHAHHKGIIHRDLKPTNLLVSERDGRPVPKIIDFGVAKATAPGLHPSDAHTRIGHLIGTPEYMSPEQAQLSPLDIDTRTDVYSLGVVLYQLLVGSLPYRLTGDTATPAQIMNELLACDIRAPSEALRRDATRAAEAAAQCATTPRHLMHAVRGDLDWIVLKTLEKDRNRRYASVAGLAADVRRHLANEPVLAGPPSAVYRLKKFVARHRVGVAATAGLFIAAIAFGAIMALQAQELARERDAARFQAARAEASSEFMSLMVEQVGTSGQPMTMVELLDAGVGLLDRQYHGDPRFVGRMLLQMSRRYGDLQNSARQQEVLTRAESIARSLQDDELLAHVDCVMVGPLIDGNALEQATNRLEEAKLAAARIARPPIKLQVDCLRAEADILRGGPDPQAARAVLERARALQESSGSTRGLEYANTLSDLSGLHFAAGEFKEALELNRLTRDAFERNGRGGTLGMVITIANQGQNHLRLGEVRRAEELGREVLDRLHALRTNEPIAPAQSVGYAITLIRLDRAAEAERLLTEALAQARADDSDFWAAYAAFHRGRALLALGRPAESEADFLAAETHWNLDPTGNRVRLGDLERSRAELDLALGRAEQARARIAALLTDLGFPDRRDGPVLPPTLRAAARIELSAGSTATAERYARAAVEVAETVARDPEQSADVGEALLLLGLAQREAGNLPGARQSFERATVSLTNGLGAEHRLTREAKDAAAGAWREARAS
jgi:non-specific serine/threonine protein kinase/serine/threonine-protein kinase